jgi:hypothetical protein
MMTDASMGSPRVDRNFVDNCWKLPNAAALSASTNYEQLTSVPVLEMALNLDKFKSQVDSIAASAA